MIDETASNVMPHSDDLEMQILASCMLGGEEAVQEAVDILEPDFFYRKANHLVFESIGRVFRESKTADLVSVAEDMKNFNTLDTAGGITYISSLADYPIAVNVEYVCRKIEEKYRLRQIIENSYSTLKKAFNVNEDFDHVMDFALEKVHEVADGAKAGQSLKTLSSMAFETIDRYEAQYKSKKIVTGIPTGLHDLDAKMFGLHGGELTLIAARPGMGKTALALNILRNAAQKGIGSFFMSLEMQDSALFDRLVAMESGVDGTMLRTGAMVPEEFAKVNDAVGKVSKLPIYIDDRAGLTFPEIRKTIRRNIKRFPEIKLVVVDHIQLIKLSNINNVAYSLGEVSQGMKVLAKELRIPVICLAQLNRELERRTNPYKRPVKSDLRDSGSLEQDADNIIFIYRPSVYADDCKRDDPQVKVPIVDTAAELIVSKQRQGVTGTIDCHFFDKVQRFVSISTVSPDEQYAAKRGGLKTK